MKQNNTHKTPLSLRYPFLQSATFTVTGSYVVCKENMPEVMTLKKQCLG